MQCCTTNSAPGPCKQHLHESLVRTLSARAAACDPTAAAQTATGVPTRWRCPAARACAPRAESPSPPVPAVEKGRVVFRIRTGPQLVRPPNQTAQQRVASASATGAPSPPVNAHHQRLNPQVTPSSSWKPQVPCELAGSCVLDVVCNEGLGIGCQHGHDRLLHTSGPHQRVCSGCLSEARPCFVAVFGTLAQGHRCLKTFTLATGSVRPRSSLGPHIREISCNWVMGQKRLRMSYRHHIAPMKSFLTNW